MSRLIDADELLNKINAYVITTPDVQNVKHMISDAPTIEPKQEWIPVSERLPGWNEGVLLYIEKDCYYDYPEPHYEVGWLVREGYFNDRHSAFVMEDPDMGNWTPEDCVIAWMPLPKPYSESTDSNFDSENVKYSLDCPWK